MTTMHELFILKVIKLEPYNNEQCYHLHTLPSPQYEHSPHATLSSPNTLGHNNFLEPMLKSYNEN